MAMQSSVSYKFTQRLDAPARIAYQWCTDYQPNDLALMHEKGKRNIRWLTKDTVILREVVHHKGKKIRKVKLVKLNPSDFSWYNVQLSGPNKHSVFVYRLTSEGANHSRLSFTGLLVEYGPSKLSDHKLRLIARRERLLDASAWKHLAKALHEQTIIQRKEIKLPAKPSPKS